MNNEYNRYYIRIRTILGIAPMTIHEELATRTRTAQLFFAVTALNCYNEKELSCSGPTSNSFRT